MINMMILMNFIITRLIFHLIWHETTHSFFSKSRKKKTLCSLVCWCLAIFRPKKLNLRRRHQILTNSCCLKLSAVIKFPFQRSKLTTNRILITILCHEYFCRNRSIVEFNDRSMKMQLKFDWLLKKFSLHGCCRLLVSQILTSSFLTSKLQAQSRHLSFRSGDEYEECSAQTLVLCVLCSSCTRIKVCIKESETRQCHQ